MNGRVDCGVVSRDVCMCSLEVLVYLTLVWLGLLRFVAFTPHRMDKACVANSSHLMFLFF